MTVPRTAQHWLLIESPEKQETLYHLLKSVKRQVGGIMLRFGTGIDPFLLAPLIAEEGLKIGLFLHFRDMNFTALASIVRSALFSGITRVFLGDPLPQAGIRPVQAIDGPGFLARARSLSGNTIQYGVCNRLAHRNDRALLEKYLEAGLHTAAVPPKNMKDLEGLPVEIWEWNRYFSRKTAGGNPVLTDLTHISESALQNSF